jgi:hypothetical protein
MKIIYNKNGTIDFIATREIVLGNPSDSEMAEQIANNKAFLANFSGIMGNMTRRVMPSYPANKTPSP